MSEPTTSIRFNSAVPAPPTNEQNIVFQSDGGTPQQSITASDPVMVGDTGSGGKAGNVPAPAAGDAAANKFLRADGTWSTTATLVIGFLIPDGAIGNTITPPGRLIAPRAATLTKCKVVINSSDGSTVLTFRIMQNGTNVFSTNPTFAAGISPGTLQTFSLSSSSLTVAADDQFTLDILSGSSNWSFNAQLEV